MVNRRSSIKSSRQSWHGKTATLASRASRVMSRGAH